MQQTHLDLKYIFMGMLVVSLLGGCSFSDFFSTEKQPKTVTDLMEHGEDLFNQRRYVESGQIFQTVRDRYPYSGYAAIAEVMLADGYYEREQFEDAYIVYNDFERLHPKNERIPYVMSKRDV